MIENYDQKLKTQIAVQSFLPPHVNAQIVIEANEARANMNDERAEAYLLQIYAAFEVEADNTGYADFSRMIIDLAYAEGKARGKYEAKEASK